MRILDMVPGDEVYTSKSEFEKYIGYDVADNDWSIREEGGWLITYRCGGCRVGRYDMNEGTAMLF